MHEMLEKTEHGVGLHKKSQKQRPTEDVFPPQRDVKQDKMGLTLRE